MTFRAKPPRRRPTSTHDDEARRARLVLMLGGTVSDVITDTDGLHLYFVKEREQRAADEDQLKTLKDSAFSHWYDPQKATADIWRDEDLLSQLTTAS